MFIKDYKKFLKYFGKGYKLKLSIFTVLSVFAGLMEFLGISLIYPFVVLVIKPDAIINKVPGGKPYATFTDNYFVVGNSYTGVDGERILCDLMNEIDEIFYENEHQNNDFDEIIFE